jgi:thiol-disulfide isomerase/thioredoxin
MRLFGMLIAAAFAVAAPAQAGESHFDGAQFQAIQQRNAPVILFVHAPWCPICRAQEKTVAKLLATPRYKGVTVLTIDFDTQKSLWSKFGVTSQSTLIAFHGRRETGRLSYDSDPAKITALFASALS